MIVNIALGLGLGLVGLGVLGMIVSGIRSVMKGKQDVKKIVTMIVPFIVFGIAYGITGTVTEAAIGTMVFMIAAMVLLIFLTGMRTTFNL